MHIHVVPGQVTFRWCDRCASFAALEVGVYALTDADPPEPPSLVGTFTGCTGCDPDLFAPTSEGVSDAD